jgi:hypothetical protein
MFLSFNSNTTCVTCGAGTADPSRAPEFTPVLVESAFWLKEHNGKKIKHSITKQQQYKHKNKTQQNITEVLEDTKGLTRSSKSKDRQHNGQKNKDKQRSTKHYTEN